MDEIDLVGYTADLQYLVFSEPTQGRRFKSPVDEDLLSTLDEVLDLAMPEDTRNYVKRASGDLAEVPVEPPPVQPASPGMVDDGYVSGAPAALAVAAGVQQGADNEPAEDPVHNSKLSPREIQVLLRAGYSARVVARRAEIDEQSVRRWLPPIEAERARVLQQMWKARVERLRLGPSHDPAGDAVEKNLASKGLEPGEESIRWEVYRGEGDRHWTVTLRYRSRGRAQRAVWHFDPDSGEIDCRNDLAGDIAWTRPPENKRGRQSAPRDQAGRGGGGSSGSGRSKGRAKSSSSRAASFAQDDGSAEADDVSAAEDDDGQPKPQRPSPTEPLTAEQLLARQAIRDVIGKQAEAKKRTGGAARRNGDPAARGTDGRSGSSGR